MAMTPEERATWLQNIGYSAPLAWLPLAEEIDETNVVLQLQRTVTALRFYADIPVGN